MFTRADIDRAIAPTARIAGLSYARSGRVVEVTTQDGVRFESRVRGTGRALFDQIITIRPATDGTYTIAGLCTCPAARNCKHVAAALLSHLSTQPSAPVAAPMVAPPRKKAARLAVAPPATVQTQAAAIPPGTPAERLDADLVPVLHLIQGTVPFDPELVANGHRVWFAGKPHPASMARLAWRYGPFDLPFADKTRVAMHEGRLREIPRDDKNERKAAARLRDAGFTPVRAILEARSANADDMILLDPSPTAWVSFIANDLPSLRASGWQIEVARDFPYQFATPTGDVSIEVREGTGTDWLDLDLGVMVDGTRINLVPHLVRLLSTGGAARPDPTTARDIVVPLPDGRHLAIPFAQIQPILGPLLDLFDGRQTGNSIRVKRHDSAEVAALEAASHAAGIAWSGGDAARALGRQLRDHGGIPPCVPPDNFNATLRTYQTDGLAWLQFLRTAGLGGVLADDMGLGKTVQALAHLAVEQAEGRLKKPALVICPTSLVANWRTEANRFAPTLRTLVLHGATRAKLFDTIAEHDLIITTYPLLARDHEVLALQEWHIVMLDEAQIIKNPLATTSMLARTLRAGQRLCLSGTPLENHLGELWSLFDFLMPGFLGNRQAFSRRFRTPIEKGGDTERQSLLARRVAPFLLRRTKQEVASDLPPKTEIAESVDMGDNQRAIYESIRLAMHDRVREAIESQGLARSGIVILDALLKLRQVCCDPRLLKLDSMKNTEAGSAKLERLMEMLPQMLEEGRRILLFSQFTSMLALIEAELNTLGLPYVILTGKTKDRATPIRRFQEGEVPLFLVSLKAGGVGLNLTAADTVIHYDPWWNPAVEDQATDRAHRIGQDKPVFVHRLITEGTIEEKMETLKQRKQSLVAGVLGTSGEAALTLTEADLEMLLAPANA